MGIFFATLIAVSAYISSNLCALLFINPIQKYRSYAEEAVSLLYFYSRDLNKNPLDELKINKKCRDDDAEKLNEKYRDERIKFLTKAQDELRMCMANLRASYYSIKPRWIAIKCKLVPCLDDFREISSNLIRLSHLGGLLTEGGNNLPLAEKTVRLLSADWYGDGKLFV